jgi:hypothetical protein
MASFLLPHATIRTMHFLQLLNLPINEWLEQQIKDFQKTLMGSKHDTMLRLWEDYKNILAWADDFNIPYRKHAYKDFRAAFTEDLYEKLWRNVNYSNHWHTESKKVSLEDLKEGLISFRETHWRGQTQEMVDFALEEFPHNIWFINFGNNVTVKPHHALKCVKARGLNLKFIPAESQTQEVIEAALKQDPGAKEFIKTKGLMMEALGEALDE